MKSSHSITSGKFHLIFKDPNIRFSFICILLIIIVATQLMSINRIGTTYNYNIGDIAKENIKVHKEIHYENVSETDMDKKMAAETAPLVYDKNETILLDKLKSLGILFTNVKNTLEENPPLGTDDLTFQLVSLKSKLPKYLLYGDKVFYELLSYKDTDYLKKTIFKILIYIYDNNEIGILGRSFENPLDIEISNISVRVIKDSGATKEISKTVKDLESLDSINKRLYKICYSIAPNFSKNTLQSIVTVVRKNLRENLKFNVEETKRRITEKVRDVRPVMEVLKVGQSIAREGDTITTEIMNKISILNRHATSSNVNYIIGVFIVQLIFLTIFSYFILTFRKLFFNNKETSIIFFFVIILFMIYTFLLDRSKMNFVTEFNFILFLPIPFVTMIITILFNIYLAMIVGIYIIFFTVLFTGGGLATIILAFSSALLGVIVTSEVEKRTDILRGGFIIGMINSIVLVAIALIKGIPMIDSLKNLHLSFANGIVSSIVVLGIIPVFEGLFSITTKFKLSELSDLNAKIFKNMLVQAPGTYNHSLIVSTMAEAACNDIGANHLLARVGGYYHDIGKIEDAGIFIENKVTDPRAGTITSKEYARLIISHVQKGVELAKQQKLPENIISIIREHHGTSLMTYFYHQALEKVNKSKKSDEINKNDFYYPGPKPRSREAAIIMLADSIEAASRTLQNPDNGSLKELVKKIIYNRLNEGELAYSDLTLSDVNRVQRAFLRILTGIFHTRIEYPEADELEKLEKKAIKNGNVIE